jgi:hypothetical protein
VRVREMEKEGEREGEREWERVRNRIVFGEEKPRPAPYLPVSIPPVWVLHAIHICVCHSVPGLLC